MENVKVYRLGVAALALAAVAAQGCTAERAFQKKRGGEMPGGAFNLRIVSDSVPDWSSRENFVHSALSGWATDPDKALAQFRWMHRCRRVGSYAPEDSRPVLDPVLFFNSYGITYCSMISEMNVSLWEAAGWRGRAVDINGHVISEVHYGGAWHMFDNDFCNYFLNEKGEVAGAGDLHRGRVRKPGKYYLFDHCPTASCRGGRIFMGPSSWSLKGKKGVALDWYRAYRPRSSFACAHAGHRYVLGVRLNESYTRYWKPLGYGKSYARPFRNGKDPAKDGSQLKNSRANGSWSWRPDLSDPNVLFASENVRCGPKGIRARDPKKPASAVFRVMAANVVTSAHMSAFVIGNFKFSVSGNGGVAWTPVSTVVKEDGVEEATLTGPVAGRIEYLLKAEFTGKAELKKLEVGTVTQVNPRALPALKLGGNRIAALSDEHLEYITFNPRLTANQYKKEAYRAKGWQSLKAPRDKEPSIRATGPAELVLRAVAPRDIRHVRMAATAHLTEPAATFEMEVSFDGGKKWQKLGTYGFKGAPYDPRLSAETRKIPRGAREVLLRYKFDDGGSGLVNVFAEVGYRPAGPRAAYDVTYSWSEYRDGKWVERRHLERVVSADHRYAVNVGGSRPPRMNWVRNSPVGKGKTGYSDGQDAGGKSARPGYRLTYGKKLSTGCNYTVNRKASKAFPDKGGKTLTDGYISLASYWGLGKINLTGEKNARRVGELVVWEAGPELVVTVDLGKQQKIGGARVRAVQPNKTILYPEKMVVEVSADGKSFKEAGSVGWEQCFFPPADAVHWEGTDSPIYDDLPAGGITDFRFPVLFKKTVKARYVRFRLAPPAGGKAGLGLWELEVFDGIKKSPWSDRLQMPAKLKGK